MSLYGLMTARGEEHVGTVHSINLFFSCAAVRYSNGHAPLF